MPSPADLNAQGDALAALLEGVHADATVAARGEPECLIAILIRPVTGQARAVGAKGADDCTCETRWVVFAVASLDCELEAAQRTVYELMSGCGDRSIPARLKPARKTPTALYVTVGGESVRLGAAVHAVDPASGFGLIQYKTDGPPNAYAAQVQLTIRYDCC